MTDAKRFWYLLPFFLGVLGILDAGYLTWEHYNNVIPPCTVHILFADCGKVLTSPYAVPFGIPLALIGLIHYVLETMVAAAVVLTQHRWAKRLLVLLATGGLLASAYFVYLMVGVIGALCLYCLGSALISTVLFAVVHLLVPNERVYWVTVFGGWIYRRLVKPVFFLLDPEHIHTVMVQRGQLLGSVPVLRRGVAFFLRTNQPFVSQTLAGLTFRTPVGLAAGFDYEARLTRILAELSFGFQSVGTITNLPYQGNPRPMLGRLPRSRSLMVNKGFKNDGADATINRLKGIDFPLPVGISIGRTNGRDMSQAESVQDIVTAFKKFEGSSIAHAYYELNISCPNLQGNVSFYPPKQLEVLLTAVGKLRIRKPVFIKMPIEKTDAQVLAMLRVIAKHRWVTGVIFGNLQKDRQDPALNQDEVARFPVGNFSGKPTFRRSNELISLAYAHYRNRFIIIGCGGVFSAADAYEKIKRGASLVQLITGMIYQGPQVIAEITLGLEELAVKDGYRSITEAIGTYQNS